jgi:negative regulator of sigma-B (phosphoserine phosphatase)
VSQREHAIEHGVAALPLEGQRESGDLEVVATLPGAVVAAVIDGLGHGAEAAVAARLAAATLRADPGRGPAELIRRCHAALRGTRGVVMSVAAIDTRAARLSWCGVGNVEGCLVRPRVQAREAIALRGGVVGYALPELRETMHALADGDVIVLATDGIAPGFCETIAHDRPAAQTAHEILQRYGKTSDDALVLVLRVGAAA